MRTALLVLLAVPAAAFADTVSEEMIRAAPPSLEVKVTIGPATKRVGPLASADVEKTVKARTGIFRACYQKEAQTTRALKGKVVLELTVEPDGTVKAAKIGRGTTLKNENVHACLQNNVMRLAFPDAQSPTEIVYPMTFSSTKKR